MAFDFPSSPAEGQVFAAPGGPTYVFNTPVWKAVGQGQIAIISDTPPSNPANGALWYESDSGMLFIWVNDGNSSQWVQVGGIQAGAPVSPAADNAEYVMVNGAWRLKSQSFNLAGLTALIVPVPAWGPNMARLRVVNFSTVMTSLFLHLSLDGTTFPIGASDYANGGPVHQTGSGGYTGASWITQNAWVMSPASENVGVPHFINLDMTLTRLVNGNGFTYHAQSSGYQNAAALGFLTGHYGGGTSNNATTWAGTGPLKAFRLTVTVASPGGWLDVEWLP